MICNVLAGHCKHTHFLPSSMCPFSVLQYTGAVVSVAKRLQINVFIKKLYLLE